jgi:hypothetical protein
MKKQIAEFFSKCGNLFRRDEVQPDSPAMAKYREFFYKELEWVQKNPELAAHIFASNRFDDMIRDDEREMAERPKDSVSCEKNSVGNESERKQRTEQLIELGKSYSPPVAERCPEKDEPDLDRD